MPSSLNKMLNAEAGKASKEAHEQTTLLMGHLPVAVFGGADKPAPRAKKPVEPTEKQLADQATDDYSKWLYGTASGLAEQVKQSRRQRKKHVVLWRRIPLPIRVPRCPATAGLVSCPWGKCFRVYIKKTESGMYAVHDLRSDDGFAEGTKQSGYVRKEAERLARRHAARVGWFTPWPY